VRANFEQGVDEYIATQRLQADHPGALANLGSFFTDRGELDQAELAYRQALRISPGDVRATIGLADLYRVRADDGEAVALLRTALKSAPASAELHHALGLALVRRKDSDAALEHLARAAALAPEVRRYAYVLAVARRSYGQPEAALAGLEPVFYRYANDIDMIFLLAELNYENNNPKKAIEYAERLVELIPDDPRALEFLQGLLNSGE
jgi:Flp pilus assembly protein TadD